MFRTKTSTVRAFKKGLDAEDARRKREDFAISLGKNRRDEQMQKRRQLAEGRIAAADEMEGQAEGQVDMRAELAQLPAMLAALRSADPAQQYQAVCAFRKLLSVEHNPPIQQVIDCGAVPRLVEMLSWFHNDRIQFEAAWALTNIASGTQAQTRSVIAAGGIRAFVSLLGSPKEDVKEQAVWALGNIAGDSSDARNQVLQAGALNMLVNVCQPGASQTLVRNAVWTISNLCRGKPQPPFELIAPCVPKLATMLFSPDEEVLTDACWALSYVSDDKGDDNTRIRAIVDAGIVPRLVSFLGHHNEKIRTPALRAVGNIVTGDDRQTQAVLDAGALAYLARLLGDAKKAIRKEACWTLSNITAGTPQQIQACINAGVFPDLVRLVKTGEYEVQKEALWAISNATSGGQSEQIRYLVRCGAIEALVEVLSLPDSRVLLIALEGIENILRHGQKEASRHGGSNPYADVLEDAGGLDAIEELQRHDSEEVYQKAKRIIETFFAEDEEAEADAPQTNANGTFSFSASTSNPFSFSFGSTSTATATSTGGAPVPPSTSTSTALTVPSQPFAFRF